MYDPKQIEQKWQTKWEESKEFASKIDESKPKKYIVAMFPYPSGSIHMGHMRCYTISDVISRYWKNKGYNVCNPFGFDAFGSPAETAAINRGIHPREWTRKNIEDMKTQIKSMGMSIDWDREISTCEMDYWKHEQQFFIDMWNAGMIERKVGYVNWDPVDKSVVSNEQVINGKGWRSGATIEQKEMVQYYFKTTHFAQDMFDSIQEVESTWPEIITNAQKQFIKNGSFRGDIHVPYSDWCISRQKYWGTPIPMIKCKKCGVIPNPSVHVVPPDDVVFDGKGNPMENHPTWKFIECPSCGGDAEKETDTMDTFVQSSWYFIRYISDFINGKFDEKEIRYWFPIDFYVGGPEHSIGHMIYSRFFWRVFKKIGYIPENISKDPFKNVITQGMVKKDGRKMSKSHGNGVSPSEIIEKWGCDVARMYMMFAAPPDQDMEWNDGNIIGVSRFVNKFWNGIERMKNMTYIPSSKDEDFARSKIEKIKEKSTMVYEQTYKFNTIIAFAMETYNAISKQTNPEIWKEGYKAIIDAISPIAPHMCSEMNEMI